MTDSVMGRPRKYDNPQELEDAVYKYFEQFEGDGESLRKSPTVAGLALYLGFESRQSIYDYAENGNFSYIIKKALLQFEDFHESALNNNNVTGHVFWLKNHGWKDKSEVDNTLNIKSAFVEFGDGNGEGDDTDKV
jgi:hypothetical protein